MCALMRISPNGLLQKGDLEEAVSCNDLYLPLFCKNIPNYYLMV